MDIRLDYVSKFKDQEKAITEMTALRAQYMALDATLKNMTELGNGDPAFLRSLSIARTHLETSCQYGIKSLCLGYEDKS